MRRSNRKPKIVKYKGFNRYIVIDDNSNSLLSGVSGQSLYMAKKIKDRIERNLSDVNIINYYVTSKNGMKIAAGFFIEPNKNSKFQKQFKKKYPNTQIFKTKDDVIRQHPYGTVKFRKGRTYL